jgi:hypothetical protein
MIISLNPYCISEIKLQRLACRQTAELMPTLDRPYHPIQQMARRLQPPAGYRTGKNTPCRQQEPPVSFRAVTSRIALKPNLGTRPNSSHTRPGRHFVIFQHQALMLDEARQDMARLAQILGLK